MEELRKLNMFRRSFTPMMSATSEAIRYNARLKLYPDGSGEVLCAERCIFRAAGWEERRRGGQDKAAEAAEAAAEDSSQSEGETSPRSDARARRRARAAIRDLGLSNDFKYFVTFTLDASVIDRYDIAAITKKLNVWLDNNVRRRGLKYVLVPELHKDGAIHFHGLVNDALPVVDSGTVDIGSGKPRRPKSKAQRAAWLENGGRVVYNLPRWDYGFSTAIELYGDRGKAINYVTKYIAKTEAKIGGRWYYSGGQLRRPVAYCCDIDYKAAAGAAVSFVIEELSCSAVKISFEKGGLFDGLRALDRP